MLSREQATIEDVAEAAGVSVATVSRALRGLPNVAPLTRERVRDVATSLQYRANPSAAALAAGRTQIVAMAVPLLDSWYFSKVMAGAEAVISEAGYDLLLLVLDDDERRQRFLAGPLLSWSDGLIVVDLHLRDGDLEELNSRHKGFVTVGRQVAGASAVVVDDFSVGVEAVSHLLDLGHRQIALLEGAAVDPFRSAVPSERRRGYQAALASSGIDVRPDYIAFGNWSIEGGTQAARQLLDLDDRPTAIFAMSDEMAFGAMEEARRRGLDVPGDVSVIGVDDHELSEMFSLSTIGQHVAAHGASAARLLLRTLADPGVATVSEVAETALISRGSTGPPGQ